MRIDKVYIEKFKNLHHFNIDLDETNMQTVLLGENAAGKSNFLEALVIIFRDLELGTATPFNFKIEYQCKDQFFKAVGGPNTKGGFQIYEGGRVFKEVSHYDISPISKTKIKKDKFRYLPRYVFAYYSGVSDRLLEHFDPHQNKFYRDLLAGVDDPMRPLFYARLIHSHFVLMAFYAFSQPEVNEFLEDYLDIIGLESILFVLKKPNWSRNNKVLDFWGAKGVVREFLEDLYDASMAPISTDETVRKSFRKSKKETHLFLYISNQEKLEKIANKYGSNAEFFKRLESTYISDLILEVRVKVKKRHVNGDITFKELSEGEQQLLTVLGLLRFTKEDESLILLDEPDTHLNPLWKWKYMNLLEEVVQKPETSQIIMTTHDPLVIGGLTKEEIRIFYTEKGRDEEDKEIMLVKTTTPDFDPKGLGVAGILTSEFFNLPSAMDEESFEQLNRKRVLDVLNRGDKLSDEEKLELESLEIQFSKLGLTYSQRDPLYQKFIEAVYSNEDILRPATNINQRKAQEEKMAKILKEIMDQEDTE
jgi:AAA15 family ATPase/GTPase